MSFMDKKTALKVLGLTAGATRDDAKTNYRKLAKTYHPDLSSGDSDATAKDLKMKEINIAYRFLIPLLKLDKDTRSPSEKKTTRNDKENIKKANTHPKKSLLSKMIREVKHAFRAAEKSSRKRKPTRETSKKRMSRTVKMNSNIHFDEILSKFHVQKDGRPATERKQGRTVNKNNSHKTYRRYMELKRKMKANKTNQQTSVGRVERITPIDPVKPVNKI